MRDKIWLLTPPESVRIAFKWPMRLLREAFLHSLWNTGGKLL